VLVLVLDPHWKFPTYTTHPLPFLDPPRHSYAGGPQPAPTSDISGPNSALEKFPDQKIISKKRGKSREKAQNAAKCRNFLAPSGANCAVPQRRWRSMIKHPGGVER
jgi:hypothetical protein